jgi:hypothetical protein
MKYTLFMQVIYFRFVEQIHKNYALHVHSRNLQSFEVIGFITKSNK